jgi:hypothetical protein
MKTIKFRAKRQGLSGWAYGLPDSVNGDVIDFMNDTKGGGDYIQLDTLGQFTGLTSKSGKDIYEGDTIEGVGAKHTISYSESEARFVADLHDHPSLNKGGLTQAWIDEFEKELIGNIHETE